MKLQLNNHSIRDHDRTRKESKIVSMLSSNYRSLVLFTTLICSPFTRVKSFVSEKRLPNYRVPSVHVERWCQESEHGSSVNGRKGDSLPSSPVEESHQGITILPAQDNQHLWKFLVIAAHENDLKIVQSNPDFSRYVDGYDPTTEVGFVAFANTSPTTPVGAAWVRFWPSPEHRGFGYIRPDIPELAIGVDAPGRGTGSKLLAALLEEASARKIPAVSLSCQGNNRAALALYHRFHFRKLADTEVINGDGIASFSMIRWLPQVRRATLDDFSVTLDLKQRSNSGSRLDDSLGNPGVTEEDLKESLFGPSAQASLLLAEIDGKPVGFVEYFIRGPSSEPNLWIMDWYIDSEWKNFGAERKLWQEISTQARHRNCTHIGWRTNAKNETSSLFHQHLDVAKIETHGNAHIVQLGSKSIQHSN